MPEVIEIKKLAGHAPAVKVGGMRISQGRSTSFSEASPSKSNKSDDLDIEEKIENKNVQPTLISGTPVKV
jgi:hypothetical protein